MPRAREQGAQLLGHVYRKCLLRGPSLRAGTFGLFLGDQRSSVKLELDQSVVQTSGTTLNPLLKTTKFRSIELADAAFTPPSLPPCADLVGEHCPYTTSYQEASMSRISCRLLCA